MKDLKATDLKKSDFFYELPQELIAQTPVEPRDSSRLMVYNRADKSLKHDYFYNLAKFLKSGDLLVLNDSKVFPARLLGVKRASGILVEVLLLERRGLNEWEAMVRPGRQLKKGAVIDLGNNDIKLEAEILETISDSGNRIIKFNYDNKFYGDFYSLLEEIGNMPLPPYITEKLKDASRYNTIYAREIGSAAAPTAGLHFTESVFASLKKANIETAYVTLHVGQGTFRPVKTDKIIDHHMHFEKYSIPEETARKITEVRKNGGRIIAAGTTACRTLEASGGRAGSGETDIFIYPSYEFKVIDGLLTNFHLPESTLLMLVSAVLGRETALGIYEEAIRERYRFFSFGDACLFL